MNSNVTMSENMNELFGALSKAQGKMLPAAKDCSNPFFKSKYADLSSVWNACRFPLTENGLAVIQTMNQQNNTMILTTTLGHSSGQWIKSEMALDLAKRDPQTLGSTITYYRRYALSAIVGIAPDDDDGERAQSPYRNKQHEKITPIQQEPFSPRMTIDQSNQLISALNECEKTYRDWVFNYVKKTYGTENFLELPEEIFERMKASADKNKSTKQPIAMGDAQ